MRRPGERRGWRLLALMASCAAPPAAAAGLVPGQFALAASSGENIVVYDIGAVWALPPSGAFLEAHDLSVRVAADLARWQSRDKGAAETWLWDVGVTPLLHWSPADGQWRGLFVEGGIGIHVLSATQIGGVKRFSTAIQFGERLALGSTFGAAERYEIAAYVQHESNADIKLPNSGFTQWGALLRLPLD